MVDGESNVLRIKSVSVYAFTPNSIDYMSNFVLCLVDAVLLVYSFSFYTIEREKLLLSSC